MGGAIHMVIDRQYHLEHPDRPLARTTDGARARSTRTLRHAVRRLVRTPPMCNKDA
jgi:hypothetical protein